jgi:hypothetical protein
MMVEILSPDFRIQSRRLYRVLHIEAVALQ